MNDYKMLEKIKQSANSCEVPESLKPENISDKLSDKKKVNPRKRMYQIGGVAAAALALVIGISAMPGILNERKSVTMEAAMEEPAMEEAAATSEIDVAVNESFSNIFTTADGYKEVLDTMDEYDKSLKVEMETYVTEDSETSWLDRVFSGSKNAEMRESADAEMVAEEAPAAEAPASEAGSGGGTDDYSTTNLQVEGVDEGDIIKTDGNYIYIIRDNREVRIVKIDGAKMEEVTTVSVANESGEENISEIYLDGNKLSIVASGYGNGLRKTEKDIYYMDYRAVTSVYTYDLSNPEEPKLVGKVSQDGHYNTSRKVGDYIYLFTNFYPEYMVAAARSGSNDDYVDMVPYVGEEMIEPASIYLPVQPRTCNYVVISSINLANPETIVDSKAILEDANDFYITTKSIYVRKENWNHNGGHNTSIAKFSFKDGMIKGESAGIVPGAITDTFAINEYKDTLRVLTTARNGGWESEENCVTVFDDKMNPIGSIRGIAKGETIYSARFMGELGYFVTYRNVDPLFAVDFSDPSNPEILGELKITGFSEYLHFYGEDRLLGIGWETDPETGARLGMKLSMFDISNPTNLREIDKAVIANVDSFIGEYDYKALTISPEKNIIGLATSCWNENNSGYNYMVFSYEEGKGFKNQLAYAFASDTPYSWQYEAARGVYVGNILYVIAYENIYAFDMEQGYRKVGEI